MMARFADAMCGTILFELLLLLLLFLLACGWYRACRNIANIMTVRGSSHDACVPRCAQLVARNASSRVFRAADGVPRGLVDPVSDHCVAAAPGCINMSYRILGELYSWMDMVYPPCVETFNLSAFDAHSIHTHTHTKMSAVRQSHKIFINSRRDTIITWSCSRSAMAHRACTAPSSIREAYKRYEYAKTILVATRDSNRIASLRDISRLFFFWFLRT